MDLQDVLNDTPAPVTESAPVVEAPVVEAAPAAPVVEAKPVDRAPDGKFLSKEPVKEAPKEQLSERERAFLTKAQDESRKRQELERRIAEYEQKAKPQEAPKSFWDDPEAALKRHQEEIQQVTTNTRLQTAEIIARSKYADFDEKVQAFAEVLQTTPGLHQQWLQAADPAEFAYKTGKNHKELSAAGSIDTLKANWEKEIRLKVEAEFKAKQEKLEAERAAIPGSLSDARGTASPKQVWGGPPSLDDVLK